MLDIKLPGLDGYEVLAAIRRRGDTPVIMVTALAEDLDKLQALRIGADDYVVKPFNPLEVVARVKAVLRRTMGRSPEQVLRVGPLLVDPQAYSVAVDIGSGSIMLGPDADRVSHPCPYGCVTGPGRSNAWSLSMPASVKGRRSIVRWTATSAICVASWPAAGADGLLAGVRGVGYRLDVPHGQ